VIREFVGRSFIDYEYRWDSFAIRGIGGRQLFQIRQSEIESLEVLGLADRFTSGARFQTRTQLGKRVLIRAKFVRTPTVISWEGKPIAGLTPPGLKLRSPNRSKRR
jgi:hypothetical protein